MAYFPKTQIQGVNDSGTITDVPVTEEGHLEVAIHAPRLPFGSVHCESLQPEFQIDGVYGINPTQIIQTVGHLTGGSSSASNSGTGNLLKCSTGTTALSYASMQSRKRLRYRSGQGVVGRFTAIFSEPVASSILVAGYGTGESGVFFGYNGTSFGILHSTGGVREIRTLTVTTASTATNDYVVTLAGTAFNVTATNNGSTVKTAYEISKGTYTGWLTEQRGSTVVFLASSVGAKSSTFSLAQTGASTPAAGSFTTTLTGVASTDTWVTQANWNGDKLDGTGASGITIDPQYGNVFQIGIQYLGYGSISFQVEVGGGTNNPDFVTVHTLRFPNSQTATNVSQPSFPFTISAYSAGSTTDVWVATASFAGFHEGNKYFTGVRSTYNRETNGFVGSTSNTYYPIFTVRNSYTHSHSITLRANQSVINLLSMSVSQDDATPVGFFIIRDATLVGTPNFTKFSSNSCTYWDVAATSCTITNNEQLLFSLWLGEASGGSHIFADNIAIQPGETITLAARAQTGTATYVNASLNVREDQ